MRIQLGTSNDLFSLFWNRYVPPMIDDILLESEMSNISEVISHLCQLTHNR